jgi:hypothetical protein
MPDRSLQREPPRDPIVVAKIKGSHFGNYNPITSSFNPDHLTTGSPDHWTTGPLDHQTTCSVLNL